MNIYPPVFQITTWYKLSLIYQMVIWNNEFQCKKWDSLPTVLSPGFYVDDPWGIDKFLLPWWDQTMAQLEKKQREIREIHRFFGNIPSGYDNNIHYPLTLSINIHYTSIYKYHLVMTNSLRTGKSQPYMEAWNAGKIIYFYGPSIPWRTVK